MFRGPAIQWEWRQCFTIKRGETGSGKSKMAAYKLETRLYAAILDFPLPVPPRLVVQHCNHYHWIAGPQKHRYSRYNFVAIFCTSEDKCISSLYAAILNFPLPAACGSFTSISIGMGVPENGRIAVAISVISHSVPEIQLQRLL